MRPPAGANQILHRPPRNLCVLPSEGVDPDTHGIDNTTRSEEHTSELQSLMRISYAVFCLKKKNQTSTQHGRIQIQTQDSQTNTKCTKNLTKKNKPQAET